MKRIQLSEHTSMGRVILPNTINRKFKIFATFALVLTVTIQTPDQSSPVNVTKKLHFWMMFYGCYICWHQVPKHTIAWPYKTARGGLLLSIHQENFTNTLDNPPRFEGVKNIVKMLPKKVPF
jgi:hypothetical protein